MNEEKRLALMVSVSLALMITSLFLIGLSEIFFFLYFIFSAFWGVYFFKLIFYGVKK